MIEQVKVGGVQYNIPQGSAVDQRQLYFKIARHTMAHAVALAKDGKKIDADFIGGVLLAIGDISLIEFINDNFLPLVKIHGDHNTVLSVENFQGRMLQYNQLIAEVVRVNLADFFTYLDEENQPGPVQAESQAPTGK